MTVSRMHHFTGQTERVETGRKRPGERQSPAALGNNSRVLKNGCCTPPFHRPGTLVRQWAGLRDGSQTLAREAILTKEDA